jgi:hypothetical protein
MRQRAFVSGAFWALAAPLVAEGQADAALTARR